jgi:hypothetical protein
MLFGRLNLHVQQVYICEKPHTDCLLVGCNWSPDGHGLLEFLKLYHVEGPLSKQQSARTKLFKVIKRKSEGGHIKQQVRKKFLQG